MASFLCAIRLSRLLLRENTTGRSSELFFFPPSSTSSWSFSISRPLLHHGIPTTISMSTLPRFVRSCFFSWPSSWRSSELDLSVSLIPRLPHKTHSKQTAQHSMEHSTLVRRIPMLEEGALEVTLLHKVAGLRISDLSRYPLTII